MVEVPRLLPSGECSPPLIDSSAQIGQIVFFVILSLDSSRIG